MWDIVKSLLSILWTILKYPLIVIAAVFAVLGFRVFLSFVVAYARGMRKPKGNHNIASRPSLLKNLFVLFPRQFISDYFSRPADWFKYQGVIVFTGRQGSGKTVALVEQTMRMQREFPDCLCISNLAYEFQDEELIHWKQLVDYSNGHKGVIVQMDEMQNWFSSNQSKDFPPEFLEVITQNRKNRRVILGTSQVFNRLSKPLREQATEVRKCMTVFGCITFVHRVVPELNSSGEVIRWKHVGFYWFVHTPEIRNAYDTYHVIASLANSGFQSPQTDTTVTLAVAAGGRKRR